MLTFKELTTMVAHVSVTLHACANAISAGCDGRNRKRSRVDHIDTDDNTDDPDSDEDYVGTSVIHTHNGHMNILRTNTHS